MTLGRPSKGDKHLWHEQYAFKYPGPANSPATSRTRIPDLIAATGLDVARLMGKLQDSVRDQSHPTRFSSRQLKKATGGSEMRKLAQRAILWTSVLKAV